MAIANSQVHANFLNQIAFLFNTCLRLVSLKEMEGELEFGGVRGWSWGEVEIGGKKAIKNMFFQLRKSFMQFSGVLKGAGSGAR